MAVGRPLIVNYEEYKNKLAGQKLIPDQTCISIPPIQGVRQCENPSFNERYICGMLYWDKPSSALYEGSCRPHAYAESDMLFSIQVGDVFSKTFTLKPEAYGIPLLACRWLGFLRETNERGDDIHYYLDVVSSHPVNNCGCWIFCGAINGYLEGDIFRRILEVRSISGRCVGNVAFEFQCSPFFARNENLPYECEYYMNIYPAYFTLGLA